ncbi:hypothetical protein QCD85_05935 [Paenibacillus sp. PsM32]|uniref:hypothetical protein n=1 Tax=unclassified Paenibacillus TaxID=185978 RepID=UPI002365DCD0|nr:MULTISPECIES: hypothetical protein [unclassified Paenibacillus]MDN4617629.1 hypothetical protein [Paenibacillus sp. PsM32]WDF52915.1 hypothetical protein PQ460_11020 [Paenibacillus sp. KACC 21273]
MGQASGKLCIYSKKNEEHATFKKGEHIIPASLGGIKELPKGYVADDVNMKFSTMENDYLGPSPAGILRKFYGPGKRGSSKNDGGAKTDIVYEPHHKLSYMSKGIAYRIPQIHFSTATIDFIPRDGVIVEKELNSFVQELHRYKHTDLDYRFIQDDLIPKNEYYLGYGEHRNKNQWILASSHPILKETVEEKLHSFLKSYTNNGELGIKPVQIPPNAQLNLETEWNEDFFFRVSAKIVFNYLALTKGQHYVLESQFDPIRNWILNGGDNNFTSPNTYEIVKRLQEVDDPISLKKSKTDIYLHRITLWQKENLVLGTLELYGGLISVLVVLSTTYNNGAFKPECMVCDFENSRES